MHTPLEILSKYWGYTSFREPQQEIIDSVLQGRDTVALMPTGGGKSLCFQVPAMIKEGICIVVSPLIALMKDQVNNLAARNIKAIALTGGISVDEVSTLLDNCKYGNYKFLYLSPERLQSEWIIDRLKELDVNLIAVDEAHCISQWGHDFRPAYRKLAQLKTAFPKVPMLALTASATKRVQADIVTSLELTDAAVYTKSFARENIAYMVFQTEDKLYRLWQILVKNPQSSIIYVRNRKACHDISQQLSSLGITATFYHGGLRSKDKDANMQLWLNGKAQAIVASNAFGMGIDKPDVKTVIHLQLPENIESYYQEAGRAGRNGEKAFAILLVSPSDPAAAQHQFLESLPDRKFLKEVYIRLNNYLQIAYGEGLGQVYPFNLNEFCATYKLPVLKAYHALQFLDRQGVLTLSNEFSEKAKLQFLLPAKEVTRYISLNPADESAILTLLRNYPGIFDMELPVDIGYLASKSNKDAGEVMRMLERLKHKDIISLQVSGTDSTLVFNEVREDDRTINRVAAILDRQNEIKKAQYDAMVAYATSHNQCKSRMILDYFGEDTDTDCGICSYCLGLERTVEDSNAISSKILALLETAPLTSREIIEKLNTNTPQTLAALRMLAENENIVINSLNQYRLK